MKFSVSLLLRVGCLLIAYTSFAQDTFQLVTDNRQLDESSRYIIVAKDNNVATSVPKKNKKVYYLTTAAINRLDDNTIINPGEGVDIFRLSDLNEVFNGSEGLKKWRIGFDDILDERGSLVYDDKGNLTYTNLIISQIYEKVSIKVESTGSANIRFENKTTTYIRYDGLLPGFKPSTKSENADISLYRRDDFQFKVNESLSTDEKIVVSSTWANILDSKSKSLKVHYILNDGTTVSDEEVISSDNLIECETENIEIPRSNIGTTLWIIGEIDQSSSKAPTIYSHLYKAEFKQSTPLVTGSDTYILPEVRDYKYEEQVTIEHGPDVKIYYTLDGSSPEVPMDGDIPQPPTFDLDLKPIIYLGEELRIKFVALKERCLPSEVISVTITGEPKPLPVTDGEAYKPKSEGYKIGEEVTFN
ncbi:MAG: chitobiase/beta-hexosaminidase C-terminal domain-containing protein, partial [Duncaniella sp.]|nr:chitobiase/beta-hexosaminidase C-terminal domain-containing protein [Duncaniella sp.]